MEDGYLRDVPLDDSTYVSKSNWGNANINQWKFKDY